MIKTGFSFIDTDLGGLNAGDLRRCKENVYKQSNL